MNIIFLSELADKAFVEYMQTKGTVILIPKDTRLDSRIANHPDLILTVIDGTLIIDQNADSNIFTQLDTLEIPYVKGYSRLSADYPMDIAYNAVITGRYLIHHTTYTEPLLLLHSNYSGKNVLLPVKQGYTKCMTVLVDENSIITSDPAIYQALIDHMEVLFIEPEHVELPGFPYGFLGGASASFEDMVVFHGDLSKHPDYPRIKTFVEAAQKELVFFDHFQLTDIGSVLIYKQETNDENQKTNIKRQKSSISDQKTNFNKHVNIPIFISHEGCPNDCVFCNQRKITAKPEPMSLSEVTQQIETYSSTLDQQTYVELAFFGGSFTGIDPLLQEEYLKLAYEYKQSGQIHAIRLSTRPDYISIEILDRLKAYGVDIIELGVQSLNEEVLRASNRGHSVTDVYRAVNLIRDFGFQLGIQLMVGLPEDSKERSVLSAKLTAILKPEFVRIYPTLVIQETQLLELCTQGKYTPLSLAEAVDWTKEMHQVFLQAQIPVIRIGLQPTDLIAEGKEVQYGPFHPAFRQLVETAYFMDQIRDLLNKSIAVEDKAAKITILCNPKDLSQVIGHKRSNMIELKKEFPNLRIIPEERIRKMTVECVSVAGEK